ncbi:MAG: acetyl-CoA carboxylase biotin carboxyl carrier protein [Lachnospiraceae bacterium]|nr:acetyl-CoA carboxylase biotin carboxyl carrier protein [Lachnospiraceae bacterium]
MQYQEILELVKAVSEAGLSNFEYTEGNISISMSCPEVKTKTVVPVAQVTEGSASYEVVKEPQAAEPQVTAQPQEEKKGELMKSPLVGTFYAAPSEGAEPFVKVGDAVKKGQTLAIVEAMKLMNEIESEFDGVVTEILVSNEETVEFGQPLFRIG